MAPGARAHPGGLRRRTQCRWLARIPGGTGRSASAREGRGLPAQRRARGRRAQGARYCAVDRMRRQGHRRQDCWLRARRSSACARGRSTWWCRRGQRRRSARPFATSASVCGRAERRADADPSEPAARVAGRCGRPRPTRRTARSRLPALGCAFQPRDQLVARGTVNDPLADIGQSLRLPDRGQKGGQALRDVRAELTFGEA